MNTTLSAAKQILNNFELKIYRLVVKTSLKRMARKRFEQVKDTVAKLRGKWGNEAERLMQKAKAKGKELEHDAKLQKTLAKAQLFEQVMATIQSIEASHHAEPVLAKPQKPAKKKSAAAGKRGKRDAGKKRETVRGSATAAAKRESANVATRAIAEVQNTLRKMDVAVKRNQKARDKQTAK